MLNHWCCKYFESSLPFQRSCIQSRKLRKNKKHSFTGEQPKIRILSCLVAILSQIPWQRSALFSIYIKLIVFVQLQILHSTTAISKWFGETTQKVLFPFPSSVRSISNKNNNA